MNDRTLYEEAPEITFTILARPVYPEAVIPQTTPWRVTGLNEHLC